MREHQQVPEGRKADGNKMDGEKRTEDRGKSKQEETNKRKALETQNGSAGRGTERGQWKKKLRKRKKKVEEKERNLTTTGFSCKRSS